MNIKEIIKKSNIRFKEKKLKNIEYLIFENETILILIKSNNNVFKINRDDFDIVKLEAADGSSKSQRLPIYDENYVFGRFI